ncbi:MAG: 2-oxo acid dehydrogenase subunit E2 [Solirubrobacteraceae bacterium]
MSGIQSQTQDPGIKGEVTVVEPDRFERQVARRSAESRATVPALEFTQVVDAETYLAQISNLQAGLAAAVVSATGRALRDVPRLNAAYRDARYELYSRVNIGLAMTSQDAVSTPTIFDADTRPVEEIRQEIVSLRTRAGGALHASQLAGATFTVLDASSFQITAAAPLIQPPQAGALSFGPLGAGAVLRNGEPALGHVIHLGLAVDHRIVFGHHAAHFLALVRQYLEQEPS